MYKRIMVALGLMDLFTNTQGRHNCGETPDLIYACMNSPKVVPGHIMKKCVYSPAVMTECDKITCIYRESGWLDGGRVLKEKVWYQYDKFARDQPRWNNAVQYFKTYCLEAPLLPQGVYMDCVPYDITHCAFVSFVKKATPNQWVQTADCDFSREFAATCPVCPASCFAQSIPNGSCNACSADNPEFNVTIPI